MRSLLKNKFHLLRNVTTHTTGRAYRAYRDVRVARVGLVVTRVSRQQAPTQHVTTFYRAKLHGLDSVSCRVVT